MSTPESKGIVENHMTSLFPVLTKTRVFLHSSISCAFDYVITIKGSDSVFLVKVRRTNLQKR